LAVNTKGATELDDIARNMARQTAPWKAGQSWWLVGIEGVLALIIGLYIVYDPDGASDVIRFLIALVLLVVSIEQIVEGFRTSTAASAPWATLRGGVGATVAALTLLSGWSDAIEPSAARQMLALGLLAYGILGILTLIFVRGAVRAKIAAIIADVLTIVLGIVLLTADESDVSSTRILGAVAILGGLALLVYAYVLWSRTRAPV
jgi:uncharacterized membrane protein HdeD (DUF308 family)